MKYLKKIMSGVVTAALLFSMPLPAAAGEADRETSGGDAGNSGVSAFDVSASAVPGDIEGAVVGAEKAASGGYYVLATKNDSDADTLQSNGMYVYKYDEALETKEYEYKVEKGEITLGNYTASTGKTYPLFLDEANRIYAASDLLNGVISQDVAGNVYVAYRSADYRGMIALASISQHKDVFPECTCDICDTWNEDGNHGRCNRLKPKENESDEDEWESADDCPVCSAWHEAYKSINANQVIVRLVVEKLSPSLELLAKYDMEYDAGSAAYNAALTPSDIKVAADGSVYVSGMSDRDFLSAYQPALDFDRFRYVETPDTGNKTVQHARGFVIEMDNALSKVEACTYLGGMIVYNSYVGGDAFVSSLAIDDSGAVYAAGADYSGMIPTGDGVIQSEHSEKGAAQRTRDSFIAVLDPTTLKVTNATYYGGSDTDLISKIILRDGCVYAAGMTSSTDLPVSSNAYQKNISGSSEYFDGFVARLSKSLKKDAQFAATYIGGTAREDLYDMDIDNEGNVAVTGYTYSSSGYPVTDSSTSGTYYISILNNDLSKLNTSSRIMNGSGRIIRFLPDDLVLTGGMTISNGKWQAYIGKMDKTLAHADVTSVYRLEKPATSTPVYLGNGDVINIVVSFDSPVFVDGAPQLRLNLKNASGENMCAVYREPSDAERKQDLYKNVGNGTNRILFSYTIAPGDTTNGSVLECIGSGAIELPDGSSIEPRAGGSRNVDLSVPTNSCGLRQSLVYVSTTAVSPVAVTAGVESGTYGVGSVIPVMVDFGTKCIVADDPGGKSIYIRMNNGGIAYFDSTDANTGYAVFKYTVSESDSSVEKLSYEGNINILEGASLKDAYGTNVNTILPAPGAETPMGKLIAIDIKAASVRSVKAEKEEGSYKKGDVINITVEFDKPVTSTGEARLALNVLSGYDSSTGSDQNKAYVTAPAVTSSDKLVFTYTVDAENTIAGQYLDYTSASALSMADGAELKAATGSAASLNLPAPGSETSLSASKITIDTKAPSVQLVRRNSNSSGYQKAGKYYKAGEKLVLEAQFSENVIIKDGADISVKMETGPKGQPLELKYQGIESNRKTLIFAYTVAEGDTLNNATLKSASGEWLIQCADGAITDAAGNTADLRLQNPYSADNIWAGIFFDTDAPVWADGALKAESKTEQDGSVSAELTWPEASDATSGLDSSSFYYVYRDGILIKTTNARVYKDSGLEKDRLYSYSVKAMDKAGNESAALTAGFMAADGVSEDIIVDITASEGFTAAEGSAVNELKADSDKDNAEIKLKVKRDSAQEAKAETVTVLWVQMRGNKMISFGTEKADMSADASGSLSSDEIAFNIRSAKQGDTVSVFVIKDPLQLIKGTASRIMNAHK